MGVPCPWPISSVQGEVHWGKETIWSCRGRPCLSQTLTSLILCLSVQNNIQGISRLLEKINTTKGKDHRGYADYFTLEEAQIIQGGGEKWFFSSLHLQKDLRVFRINKSRLVWKCSHPRRRKWKKYDRIRRFQWVGWKKNAQWVGITQPAVKLVSWEWNRRNSPKCKERTLENMRKLRQRR